GLPRRRSSTPWPCRIQSREANGRSRGFEPATCGHPRSRAYPRGMTARLVGINHVALEVDDIEQALEFYGSLFEFSLRGRCPSMAFIDMGDQFIALSRGRRQAADEDRHFGLVVDDREAVRTALRDRGVDVAPEGSVDFSDPWGNHIQVVDYRDIQFAKSPAALRAVGGADLVERREARREMSTKGLLDG